MKLKNKILNIKIETKIEIQQIQTPPKKSMEKTNVTFDNISDAVLTINSPNF